MLSGVQVYESLKKSPDMPRDKLEQLNAPGSEHLIYEMRFLAHEARPATALYILEKNLDAAVRPYQAECALACPLL